MIKKKLLILACGRSGTLYTTKMFKKAGLDLGHETVGDFGTCSMYFVRDKTDCRLVNKNQAEGIHIGQCRSMYDFEHVWHQVREPLKCIDSLAKCFSRKVRLWTNDQLGIDLPGRSREFQCSLDDKIHWAMHYYYVNNKMCEAQAEWTYRLEGIGPETFWHMCEKLDVIPDNIKPQVSDTTNRGLRFAFKSKEQSQVIRETIYDTTWNTLAKINEPLAKKIRTLSRSYGYRS